MDCGRLERAMVAIPDWTSTGIVPPIHPGRPGGSPHRSPYIVEPLNVVMKFATTPARCTILDGWLRYRQALYDAGIAAGFQWLDGSFLEAVEDTQGRPPNDVDVVTFFKLPAAMSQEEFDKHNPFLFSDVHSKKEYWVHPFGVDLGMPADAALIRLVSYWYSMWSHRRQDLAWKGFVQVELDPGKDEVARENLSLTKQELET